MKFPGTRLNFPGRRMDFPGLREEIQLKVLTVENLLPNLRSAPLNGCHHMVRLDPDERGGDLVDEVLEALSLIHI